MPFSSNFPQLLACIYVDENCVEKSVCHQPKFSTVDHQSNFLIKYHYCVMENSLQNLVNVVKTPYGS